jgi:hypothetical protein
LKEKKIGDGLAGLWRRGLLLGYEKPFKNEILKSRLKTTRNTRAYYLYLLKPKRKIFAFVQGKIRYFLVNFS